MQGPVLEAREVTKRFTRTLALDSVSFALNKGEIVGLVGQNGAGKSTLVRIIAGADTNGGYDGALYLDGESYRPQGVADAQARGIVLMPQEVNVVPDLTVAQNLMLQAEPATAGIIHAQRLLERAREILVKHDIDLDASLKMGEVDIARQQLVMIAKALSRRARILILDEPTTSLTESETAHLFDYLRELKARGVSTIFVSHRLPEVFDIADRIVVMRDGSIRGSHRPGDVSVRLVVSEIVGTELEARGYASDSARTCQHRPRDLGLEIRSLRVEDPRRRGRWLVEGLDLNVAAGEIVGLFGLVGSGCSEAAAAIVGVWEGRVEGEVYVRGGAHSIRTPADALAAGLGYVAPDRRKALALNLSVATNIGLACPAGMARAGFVSRKARDLLARDFVRKLAVRTPSLNAPVGNLSGGNQQKVQVARVLASEAVGMVFDNPTRGVDVGARAELYDVMRQLAGDGNALLLVSTEAEELLSLCQRIVVLRQGHAAGTFDASETREEELVHAAAVAESVA